MAISVVIYSTLNTTNGIRTQGAKATHGFHTRTVTNTNFALSDWSNSFLVLVGLTTFWWVAQASRTRTVRRRKCRARWAPVHSSAARTAGMIHAHVTHATAYPSPSARTAGMSHVHAHVTHATAYPVRVSWGGFRPQVCSVIE